MSHVIVIIPGNLSPRGYSNRSWRKSHIHYTNGIRWSGGIAVITATLGTRNKYNGEQQNQTHYTGNSIFHFSDFKL